MRLTYRLFCSGLKRNPTPIADFWRATFSTSPEELKEFLAKNPVRKEDLKKALEFAKLPIAKVGGKDYVIDILENELRKLNQEKPSALMCLGK